MITDAEISLLHSCFCKFTGADLPLRSICDARRLAWQRFAAAGHTQAELETVLFYLNRKVREDHWDRGCLRFTNLVEDLNHFEEVLAEARAWKRNSPRQTSARERVVEQWSPKLVPTQVKDSCVHISKVLEAMRAAADGKEA